MHKHIRKFTLIFSFLLCILLSGCNEASKAAELATYAKEQFMEDDYKSYIQKLRDVSGLDDLEAEMKTHYYVEYNYDSNSKTLDAEGVLSFKSDDIDKYYTTEYNANSSDELAKALNNLKKEYYKETTYTYNSSKWTVNLKITNGTSSEIHVITSSGRDYELSYYGDYDTIEIDDSIVYNKEARNDYSDNNSSSEYTGSYDAKLSYGSGSVLICSSEDAMDRYLTAVSNGNQGTIDEMTTNREIAFTERNTKCNIVDKKITKAQVKLLDGSYAGNTVWVIIEALQEE